jgi:hypothetical protein
MNFVIIKLDGRYTCSRYFKYRLEFNSPIIGYDRDKDLARQQQVMLEWCWEAFGPGCERDFYRFVAFEEKPRTKPGIVFAERKKNAPRWAWYYDPKHSAPYIYIVDDTVLSHIQLKWIA